MASDTRGYGAAEASEDAPQRAPPAGGMEGIELHRKERERVATNAEQGCEATVVGGVATEPIVGGQRIGKGQGKAAPYGRRVIGIRDPAEAVAEDG